VAGVSVPRVLIIAGSDSGGGAGIQADIKTVTMLGGHAMTAITAITAQNTLGVQAVQAIPTEMVLKQIAAVTADIGVDVVKIGMIGSAETAAALVGPLLDLRVAIVFDPVMVASSGSSLADSATVAAFGQLMDIASIVTPNAPELAALTEASVETLEDLQEKSIWLCAKHDVAVLAKGGHLPGNEVTDLLIDRDESVQRWTARRIETKHTHGTGCTLASGIAAALGHGMRLSQAVDLARCYVQASLRAAPGFGAGHGPMGHSLGTMPFELIHR
jgi:hydroxymethylpyrimidine/phosphomethylpyrimidine kinase